MSQEWSWQLLRAGSFRLDGGSMFGVVPKVLWAKMAPPDELNRIPVQTNCLLLSPLRKNPPAEPGANGFVLIETGFGEKWTDKDRAIWELERRTVVDALHEVGVAPEKITHVIVTHLHFDHAAALTKWDAKRNPVPTFPNARILVQKTEWNDALANKSTMTRTYLRTHLDPIASQVELIDGEREALPGITVWPMPGHTWGQQAVRFSDGHGVVCFPGDVMPTVNHAGLAFGMGYDMLPHTSMLMKQSLLERAASENWRLVLDHEPGDAVVLVVPDVEKPGRYALKPAEGMGDATAGKPAR